MSPARRFRHSSTALHRSRGVDIRLGARLAAIEGDGRATGIALQSGERIAADLVLVATGARANDDLAAAAGLKCEDGILVDETARAAPDVYAIGDCARFPSQRYGRRVRLECVQNAVDQAKAAADAIMGKPTAYDPVPWFWSDQYEIKLQITGLLDGFDACETIGNPSDGKFSVEYRRAGKLIAVDAINDGRAHMLGRRRIAADLPEFARHNAPYEKGGPFPGRPVRAKSGCYQRRPRQPRCQPPRQPPVRQQRPQRLQTRRT